MRISDWSSDVCSSDLRHLAGQHQRRLLKQQGKAAALPRPGYPHPLDAVLRTIGPRYPGRDIAVVLEEIQMTPAKLAKIMRSEEHTSELQSLMRISYAVFCLKKKNTTHADQSTTTE